MKIFYIIYFNEHILKLMKKIYRIQKVTSLVNFSRFNLLQHYILEGIL